MSKSEVSEQALSRLVESRSQFLGFLKKRIAISGNCRRYPAERIFEEHGNEDIEDQERIVAGFYRVLRNSVIDYYRQTGRSQLELSGILVDLDSFGKATGC